MEVDASPPKVLSYTVKPGSNLIGCSHECDIVISNKLVSKQHARPDLDRIGITIMDLGSQNKTKIGKNQAAVGEPVVLSNSSTADCNRERVEGEVEHPVSSSAAGENQIVKEAPKRRKRKATAAEDVTLSAPPKVKAEPVERELMSPPSAKKALKRKPKILFTGMECTNEEEIVKHLGGAIATTASMCTHLVTDKFRRTVKSLCCIGKGTPIVDIAWIKKCQEAKTFVEHMPYLLKDTKAEKSLKFVLEETLRQAASVGGVLQGWSIHATNSVLPAPADLKEIVSCAGGKYLAKMPTRATGGSTVIVSCKEDLKSCTQAKKNGVPIVSVEFVLSGLLRYKLDVGAHSLN